MVVEISVPYATGVEVTRKIPVKAVEEASDNIVKVSADKVTSSVVLADRSLLKSTKPKPYLIALKLNGPTS